MHRHRVTEQEQRYSRFRVLFQLLAAALLNGYAAGFAKGTIFTGKTKLLCVPVLNCYSCPGALGSCPIGAMQAVAGGAKHKISFYVLGTLMLFGAVLGRLVCGFVCPFGLVQDLLHKLPLPKLTVPDMIDKYLRWVKYGILLLFVMLLPALAVNQFGQGDPWFCKYICPAGTLQGGIFHVLRNTQLRSLVGGLFGWKLLVLIAVLLGSILISRFFCRYFCPLGAFYAIFNRFSLYQMRVDAHKCTACGRCSGVCPMQLQVPKQISCGECIRCGSCKAVCPAEAITSGITSRSEKQDA